MVLARMHLMVLARVHFVVLPAVQQVDVHGAGFCHLLPLLLLLSWVQLERARGGLEEKYCCTCACTSRCRPRCRCPQTWSGICCCSGGSGCSGCGCCCCGGGSACGGGGCCCCYGGGGDGGGGSGSGCCC